MIKDSYLEFITKTGVLDKARRDILRPGSVKGVHLDESARDWNNIVNKPSVFPPESHSHVRADISDLWNTPFWDNIQDKPSTFPPSAHVHDDRYYTESEIDALLQQYKFLDLTDTPSSYSGQSGKYLKVKASEDGLEFTSVAGGASEFLDLTDTPSAYSGQAGKVLAIKSTEDGIEFVSQVPDSDKLDGKHASEFLEKTEIGIDDDDILQVDQAAGLTAGNLVRATSSGLESRTDAEILAQLSGKASSAFDWNGQDLIGVGDITAAGLIVDTNTLYVDKTNNRVGIGTTSPGAKLQVNPLVFSTPYIQLSGSSDNNIYLDISHALLIRTGKEAGSFNTAVSIGPDGVLLLGYSGKNIGIQVTSPSNILTVKQSSLTDPIADSWTTYTCDRTTKDIIEEEPTGILDTFKTIPIYRWKRKPLVSDEELGIPGEKLSKEEIEAKREQKRREKLQKHKFQAERFGVMVDDPNIPEEILNRDDEGNIQGLDLLAYTGYLHAVVKELVLKVDRLEVSE